MATFGFSGRKARIDIVDLIYPVGSIYMSVNSTSPATLFGGTWERWGNGRVPVGVDTSQTEFSTVGKTGGAKTHTLTTAQMPSHIHGDTYFTPQNVNIKQGTGQSIVVTGGLNLIQSNTTSTGSGNAHNNLQPYITCYMWKRTA